jgi:hypothetical protein
MFYTQFQRRQRCKLSGFCGYGVKFITWLTEAILCGEEEVTWAGSVKRTGCSATRVTFQTFRSHCVLRSERDKSREQTLLIDWKGNAGGGGKSERDREIMFQRKATNLICLLAKR